MVEHGGVDAARQLAQLRERLGELRRSRSRRAACADGSSPDAALEQAQLQRQGDQALLGAVVQVALQAPALGVARRDDALARGLHLGEPGLRLGVQALVLERDARRGADGLDQLGVVVERGVVDERGELGAVALDRGGRAIGGDRGHQHRAGRRRRRSPGTRAAGRPRRGSGRRASWPAPSCRSPPRVVLRSRKRSARPPRARRERSSPTRKAAGTLTSEQIASHSTVCEREPVTRSLVSSAAKSSSAALPATLGSSARRRGRDAALHRSGDHDRDGDAGEAGQRALALVDRVGDVRRSGTRPAGCRPARRTAARRPAGSTAPARTRPPAASPRATRAVRRSAASAAAPRRTAPTAPAPGSTRSARAAAWNWPMSADRKKPAPAAVMSRPLRLSGRRRQAMSPHAANDPPMSR